MRSLKKRRRIQVILLTILLLALAAALVGWAFREGINLFLSPAQVLAAPPAADKEFRLGGMIVKGSINRMPGSAITFVVTDGDADMTVTFTGILPDLFAENQGMVATGKFDGTIFRADEILAKHDETYMPRELIKALKKGGVYRQYE